MPHYSLKSLWLGMLLMSVGVLLIWWSFSSTKNDPATVPEGESADFCIQIITPATNIATGESRDFATPCDVPAGWVITASTTE